VVVTERVGLKMSAPAMRDGLKLTVCLSTALFLCALEFWPTIHQFATEGEPVMHPIRALVQHQATLDPNVRWKNASRGVRLAVVMEIVMHSMNIVPAIQGGWDKIAPTLPASVICLLRQMCVEDTERAQGWTHACVQIGNIQALNAHCPDALDTPIRMRKFVVEKVHAQHSISALAIHSRQATKILVARIPDVSAPQTVTCAPTTASVFQRIIVCARMGGLDRSVKFSHVLVCRHQCQKCAPAMDLASQWINANAHNMPTTNATQETSASTPPATTFWDRTQTRAVDMGHAFHLIQIHSVIVQTPTNGQAPIVKRRYATDSLDQMHNHVLVEGIVSAQIIVSALTIMQQEINASIGRAMGPTQTMHQCAMGMVYVTSRMSAPVTRVMRNHSARTTIALVF